MKIINNLKTLKELQIESNRPVFSVIGEFRLYGTNYPLGTFISWDPEVENWRAITKDKYGYVNVSYFNSERGVEDDISLEILRDNSKIFKEEI